MTAADSIERELKLGAWPEFELPDLSGVLDGVVPGTCTERELDAVYYDTGDLHLLRRGATLRFRRGEPPGDVWTAKLPSGAAAKGLARRELTEPGSRETIPRQFAELMRGWSFGRPLKPVAQIHTERTSLPLHDGGGNVVATLDDDSVTVRRGRRVVARFRELEVELVGEGSPELLATIDAKLHAAGAEKVAQVPKLSRAFGREAAEPWQLALPDLDSKPTLAAAAHSLVGRSLAALVDLHALLVLDAPGSAARATATVRLLGAALEIEGELSDAPPSASAIVAGLESELRALSALDALLPRLGEAASLTAQVEAARQRSHASLRRTLAVPGYTRMLRALADHVAQPPAPSANGRGRLGSSIGKFARERWRSVRDERDPDSVERLAVALEMACMAPGADAKEVRDAVRRLQGLLDEDATGRELAKRLRTLAQRSDAAGNWAAGVVAGYELARAEARVAELDAAWSAVTDKSAWGWTN